jgi:hypothetical protein
MGLGHGALKLVATHRAFVPIGVVRTFWWSSHMMDQKENATDVYAQINRN